MGSKCDLLHRGFVHHDAAVGIGKVSRSTRRGGTPQSELADSHVIDEESAGEAGVDLRTDGSASLTHRSEQFANVVRVHRRFTGDIASSATDGHSCAAMSVPTQPE